MLTRRTFFPTTSSCARNKNSQTPFEAPHKVHYPLRQPIGMSITADPEAASPCSEELILQHAFNTKAKLSRPIIACFAARLETVSDEAEQAKASKELGDDPIPAEPEEANRYIDMQSPVDDSQVDLNAERGLYGYDPDYK
uniref:Uncharacterized protein n=1 Tax=Mycena chlorophos TaxID=658473 RepID=A0ABQ0LW16_MYCCL|nr:predicted protein [Mycena chlorophos]